jgi:glycine oxidase
VKVVVVGGGVIGCAVACELSSRGADVVVLERREPGAGATQASAGMLAPYIEGHSAALRQLGEASLAMYDAFVDRVRAAAKRDVAYRRTGSLEVALTNAQVERLRTSEARYREAGIDHRWLDAHEALALEPSLAASTRAGLFVPAHGQVAARELVAALSGAAARTGATIALATAERITGSAAGLRVASDTSVFKADAVVLAAGSWSGQVAIERVPPAAVRPIRGQLLHLACAQPLASRVLWGADSYVVSWEDGTVLAGATVEDVGFDEGATVAGVRDLLEAVCELVPAVSAARFEGVRVGLRPATSDELPIVGRAAALPNVVYATGHYRNGVLLAPLTAGAVADLLLEGRERPELALMRPSRFGL